MRPHHNIRQQLNSETPSIRPQFKRALGQKLLNKAMEKRGGTQKSPMLLIHQLYSQMKRNIYLLPLSGSLMLLVMGISFFQPMYPEKSLVLARATELYSQEGVSHQKYLNLKKVGGQETSTMEEIWYNEETMDYLMITKAYPSGEVQNIILNSNDEYGDATTYEYRISADEQEISEQTEPQGATDFYSTFLGEKDYCLKTGTTAQGFLAQAVIALAKEDYSYYAVSGGVGDPSQSAGNGTLSLIQQLQEDVENYDYSEQMLEGKEYLVFTQTFGEEYKDTYYFDADTYELKKTITNYSNGDRIELDYLINGYENGPEAEEVFNPENYSEYAFVETPNLMALTPFNSEDIRKDACFNYKGEEFSQQETREILKNIPEDGLEEWTQLFQSMMDSYVPDISQEEPSEEPTANELHVENWLAPSKTSITQSYHPGHEGIDYGSDDQIDPPILAVEEGLVVEVIEDDSAAGYGYTILIDHGDGLESFYAHLDQIKVKEGDQVSAGQTIGIMGNTGKTAGPTGIHLHFEIRKDGQKVNPLNYLSVGISPKSST